MRDIIIVCNDLFGLEVYDIIQKCNRWFRNKGKEEPYRILGYISDTEKPFGDIAARINRIGRIGDCQPSAEKKYVLGVLMPEQKKQIADLLIMKGCQFETIWAPWMLADPLETGEGSIVAAYTIKPGMRIGRFVTIIDAMLTYRSVGDYSTIMRFANITGNVGECSYVGNHVYTHLAKSIGDHCFVADGSIVVNNVKSGTSVSGVPARKIKA